MEQADTHVLCKNRVQSYQSSIEQVTQRLHPWIGHDWVGGRSFLPGRRATVQQCHRTSAQSRRSNERHNRNKCWIGARLCVSRSLLLLVSFKILRLLTLIAATAPLVGWMLLLLLKIEQIRAPSGRWEAPFSRSRAWLSPSGFHQRIFNAQMPPKITPPT